MMRVALNHRPQDRQKPSSARPTQLNANTPEAIAANDAKVTMVWTDGITELRLQTAHILPVNFCPIMARIRLD
jgi:hypothetical protein